MATNDWWPEGWGDLSPSGTNNYFSVNTFQSTGTNVSPSNGAAGNVIWNGSVSSPNGGYSIGGAGGGGGSYYVGGGSINFPNYPFVQTNTNPLDATTLIDDLMKGLGKNKLSPAQLQTLLDSHQFIEMDGPSEYCLFCYALDQYRDRSVHQHMIHEE